MVAEAAGVFGSGRHLPLIRLQDLLPQPYRLRRHFHVFIVADEFDRQLQVEDPRRHQADGFVA